MTENEPKPTTTPARAQDTEQPIYLFPDDDIWLSSYVVRQPNAFPQDFYNFHASRLVEIRALGKECGEKVQEVRKLSNEDFFKKFAELYPEWRELPYP